MESALEATISALRQVGLNYSFLADSYQRASFLKGAVTSLEISLWAMAGSLAFGVVVASLLVSRNRAVAVPVRAFVEFTRNTPTLVQLYFGFLVGNMLLTQGLAHFGVANPLNAFFWVVIVIAIHKGVFHAEALRAGIEAVPHQTLESAASLGFDKKTLFLRVQLPLAVRFALPSLVNNCVDLVKSSAVASAIAVPDITYASIMIWSFRDNVLELMILILLYFAALTYAVNRFGGWLENKVRMPGYGQ